MKGVAAAAVDFSDGKEEEEKPIGYARNQYSGDLHTRVLILTAGDLTRME